MKTMKRTVTGIMLAVMMLAGGGAWAGSLTPPDAPGSTMYTLEEIYQKLSGFETQLVRQALSPTTASLSAGYYAATNLVAVDPDLISSHIAEGIVIFGVAGTLSTNAGLARVPRTGQTPTVPYTAPTGADGALQKGLPWPDPRFTDSLNGTVRDNLTGLVWLKNANAFGVRAWDQALSDCNALGNGAHGLTDGSVAGDWRLPNARELQTLVDYSRVNPALPPDHPFTGVQNSWYWTSTSYADGTHRAWYVNFSYPVVNISDNKGVTLYVWPVRDGN